MGSRVTKQVPRPLTEEDLISVGNDLLGTISTRRDRSDLPRSWFSLMTSRPAMFDALSAFHNETAQNNGIQIVMTKFQWLRNALKCSNSIKRDQLYIESDQKSIYINLFNLLIHFLEHLINFFNL